MSKYTDKDHATNHPRYEDEAKDNGHRLPLTLKIREKIIRHMCQMINDPGPLSLLDAGCGNGLIYKNALKPSLPQIHFSTGVDFVQEVVDSARNQFDSTICGDVLELDKLVNKKFNVVNSTEVFLYIKPSDREKFFNQHFESIIDPVDGSGYFILTIPNLDSIYRKIFKADPIYFPHYFNQLTVEDIVSDMPHMELVSANGIDILGNIYKLDSSFKNLLSFELSFLFKKVR